MGYSSTVMHYNQEYTYKPPRRFFRTYFCIKYSYIGSNVNPNSYSYLIVYSNHFSPYEFKRSSELAKEIIRIVRSKPVHKLKNDFKFIRLLRDLIIYKDKFIYDNVRLDLDSIIVQ